MENLKIFQKVFDFTVWMLNHTNKFPKSHRFSLAIRIENLLLEMLEQIIIANRQREKLSFLIKIDEKLSVLRILCRLAYTMKFIAINSYEYACKEIDEIGKMLGAWIKQQKGSKQ